MKIPVLLLDNIRQQLAPFGPFQEKKISAGDF